MDVEKIQRLNNLTKEYKELNVQEDPSNVVNPFHEQIIKW